MLWAVLITYGLIGCSDRCFVTFDRIMSTNPGAEPPRDAGDSGSARLAFNAPRN